MPAWLVTAGVFLGLLGVGYAFYSLVLNKHGSTSASASSTEPEDKAALAKMGRRERELAKSLEVGGIRIIEEKRQASIKLMIVNHSAAEYTQLSGNIVLSTDPAHEIATIPFNLASLGAYEAKDISAPLKTKMRAYELPDWQFVKAQVHINPASAEQ